MPSIGCRASSRDGPWARARFDVGGSGDLSVLYVPGGVETSLPPLGIGQDELAHDVASAREQNAESPRVSDLRDRHRGGRALRVDDVIAIGSARLRRAATVACSGGLAGLIWCPHRELVGDAGDRCGDLKRVVTFHRLSEHEAALHRRAVGDRRRLRVPRTADRVAAESPPPRVGEKPARHRARRPATRPVLFSRGDPQDECLRSTAEGIHLDHPGRRASGAGPDSQYRGSPSARGDAPARQAAMRTRTVSSSERSSAKIGSRWLLLDLLGRHGFADLGEMDLEGLEALGGLERRSHLAVRAISRAVGTVRRALSRRHLKREVPGRERWPDGALHLPGLEAEQNTQPASLLPARS